MQTKAVIATCDIDITWQGSNPVYRLWVNDELFTERTWIWTQEYLRESITIEGPYTVYKLRYELLPHENAQISVTNPQVVSGPGRFRKNLVLEIHDENS